MKINLLGLKDFRCFAETAIEFTDKINLVIAANGSGKSTIREAIDYALTGRCEHTDRRGAGAEDLVRDGGAKASIELEIVHGDGQNGITLTRTIPNGLKIEGLQGTLTSLQALLCERLGVDQDTINACLNTVKFGDLTGDEQKNLLFNLAGLDFSREKVVEALAEWAKANGVKVSLQNALDMAMVPAKKNDRMPEGPEVFDWLLKRATELRRDANRDLKEANAQLTASAQTKPQGVPASREQVVNLLSEIKAGRDDLLRQVGQASGAAEQRAMLTSEIHSIEAEIETLKAQSGKAPADTKPLRDKAEKAQKKVNDLALAAQGVRNGIQALMVELDKKRENRIRINTGKLACESSGGLVECPVTKEDLAKVRDGLDSQIKEAERGIETRRAEALKFEEQLHQERKTLEHLQGEITKIEAAAGEYQRVAVRLEAATTNLASRKATLESLATPANVTELEAQKAALDERVKKGEAMLAAIDEQGRWAQKHAQIAEQAKKLTAWAEAYEHLVKAFEPDGIRSRLLAGVIGPIQEHASERLKMLTGGRFDIRFEITDGFKIYVIDGGLKKQFKHLSKSEKLRIGVLMQDVLNTLTDFRFLLIDEADMLDPQNKGLLIQFLMTVADDYDQIIVLATRGEVDPAESAKHLPPGMAMFTIEDGEVIAL